MRLTTPSLGCALIATCLTLSGCYETAAPVLGPGVDAEVAPGAYRCRNPSDRDEGAVVVSAPARIGNDVIYLVTVDNDRYAVRAAAISGELYVLEARGADLRGAAHIFLRRAGADRFELMATRAYIRDRLAELARRHGVTIAFDTLGAPRVDGPPERLRAFLLDHSPALLERTSACRRSP